MLPDLEQQLAAYARAAWDLHTVSYGPDQLQLGAVLATQLVPGCRAAGIVRLHRRTTQTIAATSDEVRDADLRAQETSSGPGAEALDAQAPVVAADLRTDSRWPRWSSYAVEELGFAGTVSLPLRTLEHSFGALTLYFGQPLADAGPVVARAEAFANLLTLALGCGHTIQHQVLALERRTVIGQAQGILMSQLDLSADFAFGYLQRMSQNGNRKLSTVAAEVVSNLGPAAAAAPAPTAPGSTAPTSTALGTASVIRPPAADSQPD